MGAWVHAARTLMQENKAARMSEAQMRNGALRQLNTIVKGMLRGATAERVNIWRMAMSYANYHGALDQTAILADRIRTGQLNQAMKQLGAIFYRWLKGRGGEAVMVWRFEMKATKTSTRLRDLESYHAHVHSTHDVSISVEITASDHAR